ncbi:MAG: ExeA family protein [Acidimicrobiales bacterium]|jgi:type II secretory pathway predicted ATPase ExeA
MSVDRLCSFYGFTRMPFGRDLPPSSLYRSTAHAEAVARLTWCVAERGLGTLTGEVGCGKTVAARATVASLDPSRTQVIYCPNPTVGGRGILSLVVTALGGVPRFHRAALIPQAAEALACAEDERGRRVLVLVDESHLLDPDQLEDLRMLTNAELDSRSPAAIVLIGQPTLRRRLHQGAMAALDQRITLRVHMEGMELAETLAYIRHHVSLAGRSDPLFSDDAVAVVHRAARGLPRAVNNLSLQALVATFAADKSIVDEAAAKMAVVEVTGE